MMPIASADMEVLVAVPVFSGLSRGDIADLTAEATPRRAERGTVLFLQEEPATHFYVVFDGWMKVFRQTADGQEVVIHAFSRGESFAEAAIFEAADYPASAEVVEDARLLAVPGAPFLRALTARPEISLAILAAMSRRMRFLIQQMERRTSSAAADRLAEFLLRLCSQGIGPAVLRLPTDKTLIAARLGMQPETLSRSFARLRGCGVTTRGGEVRIADMAALRAYLRRSPSAA